MNRRLLVVVTSLSLTILALMGCNTASGAATKTDTAVIQKEITATSEENISEATTSAIVNGYGAKGALADNELTQEEMLIYALQDEYVAKGEYEAVVGKFGNVNPFSSIIGSEQTHIDLLLGLFATYGYAVPENTAADHISVPTTLQECYTVGVNAEIDNIAMYEKFLGKSLPTDISDVFTRLRNGSENHLAAFEKKA
jgi:hypothetical protein